MSPQTGQSRVECAIDRLAVALGGWTALAAATTETITASGWRRHPDADSDQSGQVAEFAVTVVRDVELPRYRLTMCATTRLAPTELRFTEVGDGGSGWVDGVDFMFDPRPIRAAIPAWRVAARQRHLDLTSPLRLARKLMAPDADVTCGEGVHPVLSLREVGQPLTQIYLDDAGLPAKVETIEDHPSMGEALVATVFGDYRRVDELQVPHRVTISVNGLVVHDEIRTMVTVGGPPTAAVFTMLDRDITDATAAPAVSHSTEWVMNYVYTGVRLYYAVRVTSASQ